MLVVILGLICRVEDRLLPARPPKGAEATAPATDRPIGAIWRIRDRLSSLVSGIAGGPHRRTAISFLAFLPLNGAANALILIGLPLLLRDRFGLGYVGISALNTAVCIGSVATMMVGARLADRFGRRRAMLVSILWCALVYWFAPVLRSPSQFYALLFLDGLVGNAANGAFMATLMECVPAQARATYSGVGSGLAAIGVALGSLAAGLCYTIHPMLPMLAGATLFTTCAVIAVLFIEETGTGTDYASRPGEAVTPTQSAP
jgi:MFS family permease